MWCTSHSIHRWLLKRCCAVHRPSLTQIKHLICVVLKCGVLLILKTDASNQRNSTRVSHGLPFLLFSACFDSVECLKETKSDTSHPVSLSWAGFISLLTQMNAVGSSCWGSSEGQNLVHTLQKLTLPTRWVILDELFFRRRPPSTITRPPVGSLCDPPLWSIHVGGRGVGSLMRASLSSGLTRRLILAYCGHETPPPPPRVEMRRHPFEVAQRGKASAILSSWPSRDKLLKTMHYWKNASPFATL